MYIYIQISRFFKGTTAKEVSSFLKLYHWVLKSTRLLLSFYKFLSEFLYSIPDGQNYFFFLEPTVSFASLFPSVINKNKPYLKTRFFEMSLQYSTYFLVRRRRKKKKRLWLTSIFLEARLCFPVVCTGKESGLGEGKKN